LLPLSAFLSPASRFSGRYFFLEREEGEPGRGEKSRREKGGLTDETMGWGGRLTLNRRWLFMGKKMLSSSSTALVLY